MTKLIDKYAPIKKVASGLAASAVVYLAHRFLHLDLGNAQTAEAIIPAVGFVVSYVVKDPRVAEALDVAEKVVETVEAAEHPAPAAPAA